MKSCTIGFMTDTWKFMRREEIHGFAADHRTLTISRLRLCSYVQSKCVFREVQ